MLNIGKNIENGKAEFILEGRIDTTTAPSMDEALKASLDGVSDLVLDFSGVEYISSAGLRVLLGAQKIMKKQGAMKLIGVNDDTMGILEVTGFLDILTVEPAAEAQEEVQETEEPASDERETEIDEQQ